MCFIAYSWSRCLPCAHMVAAWKPAGGLSGSDGVRETLTYVCRCLNSLIGLLLGLGHEAHAYMHVGTGRCIGCCGSMGMLGCASCCTM